MLRPPQPVCLSTDDILEDDDEEEDHHEEDEDQGNVPHERTRKNLRARLAALVSAPGELAACHYYYYYHHHHYISYIVINIVFLIN